MSLELNRRGFLAAAGMAGLGTPERGSSAAEETSGAIKLGVASYSLREYSRALAIRCIKELRTPYVSVKEFHLPYRSSPEELESGRKEFERAGLTSRDEYLKGLSEGMARLENGSGHLFQSLAESSIDTWTSGGRGGGSAHREKLSGPDAGARGVYRWLGGNGFPEGFQVLCLS